MSFRFMGISDGLFVAAITIATNFMYPTAQSPQSFPRIAEPHVADHSDNV
jgi:hypothetical protein